MIGEISLIYSDNAVPEDPRLSIYVQRDLIAERYGDSPRNVDNYDPFDYNFGHMCHSGMSIAEQRVNARRNAKSQMRNW